MKSRDAARMAVCVLWLLGTGCTALKEIPRSEYAAQPERKNVRVHTRDGLVYEFDHVRVEADTLVGFRRQDVAGTFEEFFRSEHARLFRALCLVVGDRNEAWLTILPSRFRSR